MGNCTLNCYKCYDESEKEHQNLTDNEYVKAERRDEVTSKVIPVEEFISLAGKPLKHQNKNEGFFTRELMEDCLLMGSIEITQRLEYDDKTAYATNFYGREYIFCVIPYPFKGYNIPLKYFR